MYECVCVFVCVCVCVCVCLFVCSQGNISIFLRLDLYYI